MAKERPEFQARLLKWKEIHELPGSWPPSRLLSLLDVLEISGVSEEDASEMAVLALQDLEVDEAADRVLLTVFGETMRSGVRQGLAHELTEERPWENFADIALQAGIYNAAVLLQQAFPRQIDRPEAVFVVIGLETASERGAAWLDAPSPDSALLLRILAGGLDNRALLWRLFPESLRGPSFAEAGGILWQVSRRVDAAPGREFVLISNHEWFDPLRYLESWIVQAHPDKPASEAK